MLEISRQLAQEDRAQQLRRVPAEWAGRFDRVCELQFGTAAESNVTRK